jgi:tripartite-type tricarboxylate transporter receptor subunit TctC
MAGLNMVHVPYKGSGPARADLLSGQVKVGCLGISSVINQHKAGQLRIIGVTSAKRSPEIPDVPAIGETVKGYEATLWSGLLAPRGTPQAAIQRIHAELTKLLRTPEVQSAFKRVGTDLVPTDPKSFADLIRADYKKWGDVVREINLKIG